MAHYVTFEQAKKLKEKDYKIASFYYYDEYDKVQTNYLENGSSTDTEFRVDLDELSEYYGKYSKRITAPEHWQVIDWLLEKHQVWIWVIPINNGEKCQVAIENKDRLKFIEDFKTQHDAYSAAFDYILENLI